MTWTRSLLAVGLGLLLLAPPCFAAAPVTLESLLKQATDLDALAEFPEPAFVTKQTSSYDRRSTTPEDATNEGWFANADFSNYLRVEENAGRKEWVMMDEPGPGAVVRIWSANPKGTLRIYLDGSQTPAIEQDMATLLGGEGMVPEPIAGVRGRGFNLYLPIPYARHCKITSDSDGFYYLVNYHAYEEGTPVETLTRDGLRNAESKLKEFSQLLDTPEDASEDGRATDVRFDLPPGTSRTLDISAAEGGSAITNLTLRARWPDEVDLEQAMRKVLLRMKFDGEQTVEVPLGDFFGSAPGILPYTALPLEVEEDGTLTSRWVMPFEESATLELLNYGDAAVAIEGAVSTAERPWTDRSMHFYAGFRSAYDIPSRPFSHRTHLNATGKGVFVGTTLAIDNPILAWWGEGDELIYVDGESFPSWFGTGTEDYFGYAWCDTALFDHAYHAQARADGPQNYGRASNSRFHIIDCIPFNESIRFEMERWHWAKAETNEAIVSYWYAMPGGEADFEPLEPDDLVVRPMPEYEVPRVAGAIEGETMRVVSVPKGTTANQQIHPAVTSGLGHLWWRSPSVGDELVLQFDLPDDQTAGRYEVRACFINAPDYGRFKLAINDKVREGTFDLFRSQGAAAGEVISLGAFDLKPQDNELRITVAGRNSEAIPAHMFGLDYLLVDPADD